LPAAATECTGHDGRECQRFLRGFHEREQPTAECKPIGRKLVVAATVTTRTDTM
jgi:hypothetical protein